MVVVPFHIAPTAMTHHSIAVRSSILVTWPNPGSGTAIIIR